MTKSKRCASVKAITYCNLYSLSVENFERVLDNHIVMRQTMQTVAAERLKQLKSNSNLLSNQEDLLKDQDALKNFFKDVDTPEESEKEVETSKSQTLVFDE